MRGECKIVQLCNALSVSKSGFYEYLQRIKNENYIARNNQLHFLVSIFIKKVDEHTGTELLEMNSQNKVFMLSFAKF